MKVLLLSYEDGGGGAGRSASKLHKALRDENIESELRVARKQTDVNFVRAHKTAAQKIGNILNARLTPQLLRLQKKSTPGPQSLAWLPTGMLNEVNQSPADVIQLNWICGLLTIEEIGKIDKPLVWRFSDMWPFAGTEHYCSDDENARWRMAYSPQSRPAHESGLDLDRWVYRRKEKSWKKPIHIVAPSAWMADCVRGSSLMKNWPVTVIPTPIDLNVFKPWPKSLARELFNLPLDKPLVLFGALGGGSDPRKGRDFLFKILPQLKYKFPEVEAVIFGQSRPIYPPDLGLPLHYVGHLNDDITLALLYSAADVMVLPSRQDNLPQTGVEAQSCGLPVVVFGVSGLADVVVHERTGYQARAFDVDDLARGVEWILRDPQRRESLSHHARHRAEQLFLPSKIVSSYVEVYRRALNEQRPK